jgi:AraC-binding-like domain
MRMHIATTDPEAAHEWLRSAYVAHSARLSGNTQAFRFTHSLADCGTFKVGVCRHSMTLNGDWEPLDDQLLFSHLLSGRFTISCKRSEVAAGPDDVFAYDPDVAMGWWSGPTSAWRRSGCPARRSTGSPRS